MTPLEMNRQIRTLGRCLAIAGCVLLTAPPVFANDWPEWRGTGRAGVWAETGIVQELPAELKVKWRVPINSGYSGPAVVDGRVFITDWVDDPASRTMDGTERATGDTVGRRRPGVRRRHRGRSVLPGCRDR